MKVKKIAETICIICCIGICVFSTLLFIRTSRDYKAGQNTYDNISNIAEKGSSFTGNINFKKLKKINSDIVGWLYLKGTVIDYPVVQTTNNDKYLHVKFDGSYGGCGTLFADCRHSPAFANMNTIIYGHHMKDGTMFNVLKKYMDSNWGKKHNQFELITPDEKYHVKLVAFLHVRAGTSIYQENFNGIKAKQKFINTINTKANYLLETPLISDRYVTLSTCAYEFKNARYVVVGKLVPWTLEEKKDAELQKIRNKTNLHRTKKN